MPTTTYQGVILAAGGGTRMGPLADHYPKSLLPVANVPLIHHHLETLRGLGVTETFIVVGHLGDQLRQAVGNGSRWGMTVHVVEQGERLGIAHAVAALEPRIHHAFVLLLGDICYSLSDPARMMEHVERHQADAVLAVKMESDPAPVQRNFSVEMDDIGRVHRVVEKPVSPTTLCKGCGIYVFTPALFDAIRKTPRSALRNEYELTDAIQCLIDSGASVVGSFVVDWDVNLTTPADLIESNRRVLSAQSKSALVGEGCRIASGTTLDETVVGHEVHIVQPCRLERCVVLPGTVIDTSGPLLDQVLYPEG